MKKIKESTDEEETIINSEYIEPCFTEDILDSDTKIFSFFTEYMSLSLKDKTYRYLMNKNIRLIKNPITSDTIIHYLCMNDDNYPLLKIINPNLSEKEQKNNSGQTILHIAVQNKCYNIVKYLLEIGLNIQCEDYRGNTPLHVAVMGGDLNIIKLLLNNNSKLDTLNKNDETPLDIARKMKNQKIINLLSNSIQINEKTYKAKKKNNNIVLKLNDLNKTDIFFKLRESKNNTINKSILINNSVNNWSLDTKNETDSQSINVYKKKKVSNKAIKNKRTINLKNCINCNNSILKSSNSSQNIKNNIPKLCLGNKSIYRKTIPKKNNNKYTLIEFDKESELYEYTPRKKSLSPIIKTNFHSDSTNYINCSRIDGNPKILSYEKYKNMMKHKNNNVLFHSTNNNNYNQLLLNQYDDNKSDISKNSNKIKEIRQSIIHKSPFCAFKSKSEKEEICKQKFLQFLKEIKMEKYGNILISEGLDDINLILKQMNEGFPKIEDTLKEIGTIPVGDRAKLLIRLQEVSNGFDFNFPFDEVYFKNNGSIMKWLKREGLSEYNKNFINFGYQSFELLLVQMASDYKINEDILKNDLFIVNEKDRKQIMNSLKKNSEQYIKKLNKNENIQKTFSNIVEKDSNGLCVII